MKNLIIKNLLKYLIAFLSISAALYLFIYIWQETPYSHKAKNKIQITTNITPVVTKTSKLLQADAILNVTAYIEVRQRERLATLRMACQRMAEKSCSKEPFKIRNSLYSRKYKLSVCEIYKCGFTSWKKAFFVMEGIQSVADYLAGKKLKETEQLAALNSMRIFAKKNLSIRKINWNESLKVITVRNPFSRLVSAYCEKLLPTGKGFADLFKDISKMINARYRHLRQNPENTANKEDSVATFEDFVNFLLDPAADKHRGDPHWMFFHKKCDPCHTKYDYIVKFETLDEDMDYLKYKLNISPKHKQAVYPRGAYKTQPDKVKHYFDQVPKDKAAKLYEMYKIDFELFGYERPQWLC